MNIAALSTARKRKAYFTRKIPSVSTCGVVVAAVYRCSGSDEEAPGEGTMIILANCHNCVQLFSFFPCKEMMRLTVRKGTKSGKEHDGESGLFIYKIFKSGRERIYFYKWKYKCCLITPL